MANRRLTALLASALALLAAAGAAEARTTGTAASKPAASARAAAPAKGQAAREAYYAGDLATAHRLAGQSGERWIGGLAAYRLQRFDEAEEKFSALAKDAAENEWTRSGAAYWAARAAIAAGRPQEAPRWLTIAAASPHTFYGLIAERQLGLDPAASLARLDRAQYPTPELEPEGGFTVDRALVYALVRQESKFRPDAANGKSAFGLMQLTPATAARVAGDDKLKRNPSLLKDPGLNLRLGQDYVQRLLGVVGGDLLHAVAAYNAGPGAIQKTLGQLGAGGDSLLAIESMPGAQTREFVERVVASYWIYRNIFGQTSETLSAAAAGAKAVAAALDR